MRNDIDVLIDYIKETDQQLAALKARKGILQNELGALVLSDVDNQLSQKDYGCGTATIETESHKIKVTVPKKVKWDQDKLQELHDKISASGDDPRTYMKSEFKVSETTFKDWPDNIQKAFSEARTVEQGATTYKFEGK